MGSDTPFAIREGEWVLRAMLRDSGIDPEAPRSVREVWEVFKVFVERPSQASGPDADGVLYQCGAFSIDGPEEFYLDFTRQLEVKGADGEYDHLEQLHCEFRFALTSETAHYERFSQWWFAGGPPAAWPAFVAMVESRPEFVELGSRTPRGVRIDQEQV